MVQKSLINQLKIHHLKSKYNEFKQQKKSIVDFLLGLEKEINKIANLDELSIEVKFVELAKKLTKTFGK